MYEAAIAALTERVRLMHTAGWSPTPKRKAAESIAAELDALADRLDLAGVAQFDIEYAHDDPGPARIGPDGRPEPTESWGASYKGTIGHMRELANTARRVAAKLPDPRASPAAPFAALILLHLRYQHGFPRPTLYDDGDDVRELQRVLEGAGIFLSKERVRNVLAKEFRDFDPHLVPDYVDDLLR